MKKGDREWSGMRRERWRKELGGGGGGERMWALIK